MPSTMRTQPHVVASNLSCIACMPSLTPLERLPLLRPQLAPFEPGGGVGTSPARDEKELRSWRASVIFRVLPRGQRLHLVVRSGLERCA